MGVCTDARARTDEGLLLLMTEGGVAPRERAGAGVGTSTAAKITGTIA